MNNLIILTQESGEKRVGFLHDDDDHEYSDGGENDKRPVSKLHRRDTPHHLKNKRVQQHLSEKAANVILSKLKEMPQPIEDETIDMNPMPLVQDVGLPIVDEIVHIDDELSNQNGIDLSAHPSGKLIKKCFHHLIFKRLH